MVNPIVGSLWKIEEDGDTIYVEVCEKKGRRAEGEKLVYVCTRTPYVTSIYGQIESCGFVALSRLKPFKNTKKDRRIKERLEQAQKEGIERSKTAYEIAKSQTVTSEAISGGENASRKDIE